MNLQEPLVLGLIFFLTFANTDVKIYQLLTGTGGGFITSQHGFLIPIGIALVLIAMKFNQKEAGGINSTGNLKLIYPLFLWFLAATLSFLLNTWYANTFTDYVGGYLSLIIIYLALRDIPLTRKTFERIMMAFSLGIFITVFLGVIVYYRIWGIPSITTMIMARYDEVRMQVYRNITFGNVGNSAAFFAMIGPSFLALALDKTRKGWMRVWFTICFLLVGCNLLVTGSRAAFLVTLLALILIFYYFKQLGKLLFFSILGIFGAMGAGYYYNLGLSGGANLFIERLINAVTLNQEADFSIFSRIEAIREGWTVF
ncbi:MAG TPA: hypothetical protein VHY08_25435, partial [Bacillota bacterium]|nr:hypothetical protein [Bacillota bacterium]